MRRAGLLWVVVAGCASADVQPDGGRAIDAPPPPATTYTLAVTVTGNGEVASAPAGISCGTDCSEAFADGADVTLTATPGVGTMFVGWSGACTGALATCSVSMTQAQAVTATFAPAFCASGQFDRFDVANTTTLPGWTERAGDWSITAMAAHQDQTAGVYSHYMTRDGATQTDGCASVVARYAPTTGNTIEAVGVVLRWTSPDNYVVGLVQDNTNVGEFNTMYIYEYPSSTMLGSLGDQTFGTSPRVRLCITGSTVTLSADKDGDGTFEKTTAATTSLAGPGLAGVMTHTFSTQPSVDDFCVGQ